MAHRRRILEYMDSDNPLMSAKESLDWLDLGKLPQNLYNPLESPIVAADSAEESLLSSLMNEDYLHFTVKLLLNVELWPFQAAILDALWTHNLPILLAARGAGKSFLLAVYSLLKMVLCPDSKIVITGNGLRQASQVFDYMVKIWNKSAILRDIAGSGKEAGWNRRVDCFEFKIGTSTCKAIPLGDGQTIRGMRATVVIADEFASISEEIFNVVVSGFAIVNPDPGEKAKAAARIKIMKRMGIWSPALEFAKNQEARGNQIITSGTGSYAFNHFYKRWKKAHDIISSKGNVDKLKEILGDESEDMVKGFDWRDYCIIRLPYNALPDEWQDPSILAQAKANLTTNQFNMEYGAAFSVDSDGFYKRSTIEAATTNKPINLNGRLVQFSALRHGEIKGKNSMSYVMGVDPAADQDNAAIVLLELHSDHRRIAHCWTTNRKNYNELKKDFASRGVELEDDYYHYIANKIRNLMSAFRVEHIIMDKNGGGIAIAEALASKKGLGKGQFPVYEVINPEEPNFNDDKEGLHCLELISPTNDYNSEANHGMLKDLQQKQLLFPLFDTVQVAKYIKLDEENNIKFDTYEDLVEQIEELKREMESIVVTGTATGKENFDTPRIKIDQSKKGHLRKDRYSALLYANSYSRNKDRKPLLEMEYKPVGGTKYTMNVESRKQVGQMYSGPGMIGFKDSSWNRIGGQVFTRNNDD